MTQKRYILWDADSFNGATEEGGQYGLELCEGEVKVNEFTINNSFETTFFETRKERSNYIKVIEEEYSPHFTSFEDFLEELALNPKLRKQRRLTFDFEAEQLAYLCITYEELENMSIIEIRKALLEKFNNEKIKE